MKKSRKPDKEKKKVIVYIDGYNLYYGMRQVYGNRYKWLDLQAFAESLIRPDMELMQVKYFTAITKSNNSSKQRQEVYLKALQAQCDKLKIYYGLFLSKQKTCRSCNASYTLYEEKKTDVNLACQILNDTHLDLFDCCYIVSGDSDLVPPLQIIKENHPDKITIVAHPPKRKSQELCQIASGWFALGKNKFKLNQLPMELTTTRGNKLVRPNEWQ